MDATLSPTNDEDRLLAAFAKAPWEGLGRRALGDARAVPTMLSEAEQKLYYWLAAFWCEGAGEIVDLGSFAGGSTARLAEGHRAAGLESGIHAYDRFTADEKVKSSILYKQGIAPFEGEDILPLAQSLLGPWAPAITYHRGEIDEMTWSGGPIEMLVMDASKAAGTMDAMSAAFMPHLVPGRSLLVQQDYLHWSQPWVPAQMERMASCFRPIAHAPRDTLVFLCTAPVTSDILEAGRTATARDEALLSDLETARERSRDWGLADRLQETIDGLRANPGKRRAFQFKRPG
ncbi:hypothetical protein RM543_06020 [Roseicyclus sp. F158]|uniref:Class I SAM-dependent methyltransferase n=1 Tax=Tropicimonas omnivorans TaxID=3075590 RepID=A0ABU3DET7_9RHOB|nr:hypothetical protein [Roseicyclus sp. F158]MDT0682233.1 hypothetical protein [Roseicyclus sp. F158]